MATATPLYVLSNGNSFRVISLKDGVDEKDYIARRAATGVTVLKVKGARPSITTLEKYSDGIAKATDGCRVEPDGVCAHGHPSWLLAEGLI